MHDWIGRAALDAFAAAGTTAYRLHTEAGGWVERFGDHLLVSYKQEAVRDALLVAARDWSSAHGVLIERVFGKLLPRQNAERVTPTLLAGDPAQPLTTTVLENGVSFGIDFGAGYSAGLFLDQRANRSYLRTRAPKRLLNTFAYTCSFSVVAALAGAETLSIDLSRKSLDRGRANFALNALEEAGHRFIADDVLEVLPRLARRGEQYDAIVLDPPTFSRSERGSRFQVERDFEGLLTLALELAAPKASILLSTNCTRLDRRTLETIARHCLKATRRQGGFHTEPPLPDIPAGVGAATVWLTLR